MTGTRAQRTLTRVPRVVRGVMAAGLVLGVTTAFAHTDHPDRTESTLLVWAADKAHLAPDFVAVMVMPCATHSSRMSRPAAVAGSLTAMLGAHA